MREGLQARQRRREDGGPAPGPGRRVDLRDYFLGRATQAREAPAWSPKSVNQRSYLDAIEQYDIVFGVGPAGTGKTYLAMAQAVAYLLAKKVSRIILARPAVEAGEKLGFLPGDLQEKVNPYLRPLYDALYDMMDAERVERLLERGTIEVAPIAFMRGRTLNDAFVILDEAQNTTSEQMKMFLTRLGFGSKAVMTGDMTQIDLPTGRLSGLVEAMKVVERHRGHRVRLLRREGRRAPQARAADRQGLRSLAVDADVRGASDGAGRRPRSVARRRGGRRGVLGARPRALARAAWRPPRARGASRSRSCPTRASARLNRRYRRKDAATDVLAFPAGSRATGPGRHRDRAGVARRQAREAGHSVGRPSAGPGAARPAAPARLRPRARRRPDGARVERRLRREGGLREGLIERGGGAATPMMPLALFLLGCAPSILGRVQAAFSALMRLSLRLMAERGGRSDRLGPLPERSAAALRPGPAAARA